MKLLISEAVLHHQSRHHQLLSHTAHAFPVLLDMMYLDALHEFCLS